MLWNKSSNTTTTCQTGKAAELIAQSYLCQQGLTILEKNYHCRQGEIDLIMLDIDTYIFIEVKYRRSQGFGGALSAISNSKQKKIKHSIATYLHKKGLNEYNTSCRVDVVTLEGDLKQPKITWLKNAF